MSQTVAVLERTQEFVNSLLFSAAAAHSKAATHPGSNESCVTANHVRVQPDAITTSMEHNLAGATDWPVGFPCRTSRMPSRMSGWLLLSKTAASELGERLWEDYQAFARRNLSEVKLNRVRTPTVGCYQKRTRSADTAIILASRVFPIRPPCPDHSTDQRWAHYDGTHVEVVDFRNGKEIHTVIQVLSPSATCRAVRRHPGFSALASERRAIRSMASSLPSRPAPRR